MSDEDIKGNSSDEDDDGEDNNKVEVHSLNYQNEIFFKSKFARQRLKTSLKSEFPQKPSINWRSLDEPTKEDDAHQIQSLREENEALKKNNSNYLMEISRLKLNVNYYKVQNIETKVLLRKTADYVDRLCRYLEEIDVKLKAIELDTEKGITSEAKFMECRKLIETARETNFDFKLSSPYSTGNESRMDHNMPNMDILKNLRSELFSFCVAGKAISTTFKRNSWYDRSLAMSPSLSSSSRVESGFSSLESKSSLREECISGYFNV